LAPDLQLIEPNMDPITIGVASGLRSRMESLDMLANNLANVSTAGYKGDREFYSLYTSAEAAGEGSPQLPVTERRWTDLAQGQLQPTAKPLDLALEGKGFFVLSGPTGPLYTRNGNFRINPSGIVTSQDGYPLQLSDGKPLQLQSTDRLQISADGSITQAGVALGRLAVASMTESAQLVKQGATNFRVTDPALVGPSNAEVKQGALESSNVNAPDSAIRIVTIMRQFEMLQKALTMAGDMNRKAVEEVAKT
jgi:flagellar basal-body rod protein FlgF